MSTLAGQQFGFDVPGVSDGGTYETQSFLARYFPELSLSFGAKGKRGSRLGRGDTAQTTRSIEFKQPQSINVSQVASPTMTVGGTTTASKGKPSLEYGLSAERFGLEDYWRNLEKGFTPAEIKEYVKSTPGILAAQNVKGGGGLYDWLEEGKPMPYPGQGYGTTPTPAPTPSPTPAPTPAPAPKPKSFSTAYGIDPNYFGGEDAREALKQGATQAELVEFLDRAGTSNLLRLQNLPGGGGLYDRLKAGTFS